MPKKGPKCKLCEKTIQMMSYDAAYVKIVKPRQAKASFICLDCAGKLLGDKLDEITDSQSGGSGGCDGTSPGL